MELQSHLDRLDDLIAAARPMPLTNRVLVDGEGLYDALDELRGAVLHQVGELDAYLRDIALSLDDLRGGKHARVAPVTAAATGRVGAIVAAAETTAARLREEAEAEAVRAREEAEADAARGREEAERALRDARPRAAAGSAEHLRRVQAATARLTELTEEVAAELGLMIDGVRQQNGSVRGRLDAVIAELEELGRGPASLPDLGVAAPAEVQEEAPAPPALEIPADDPAEAAPIARRAPSPSTGAPTVEYVVPGVDDRPPRR